MYLKFYIKQNKTKKLKERNIVEIKTLGIEEASHLTDKVTEVESSETGNGLVMATDFKSEVRF